MFGWLQRHLSLPWLSWLSTVDKLYKPDFWRNQARKSDANGIPTLFRLCLVDSCQETVKKEKKAVLGYFHTKFSYVREKKVRERKKNNQLHPARAALRVRTQVLYSGHAVGRFNFELWALSLGKVAIALRYYRTLFLEWMASGWKHGSWWLVSTVSGDRWLVALVA